MSQGVQKLTPAGIGLVVAFLILSLSIHEAAHAFTAKLRGDSTADDLGRMTINPLKHIDPVMTILVPILTTIFIGIPFGGAKPVPVNPHRLHHPLRDMMLVAIAGPLSNFVLAIVFFFLWKVSLASGFYTSDQLLPLVLMGSAFFNVILFIFNLIPVPPLDGSRVMAYLLPSGLRETYAALETWGMLIVVGLLWTGVLQRILFEASGPVVFLTDLLSGGGWWA